MKFIIIVILAMAMFFVSVYTYGAMHEVKEDIEEVWVDIPCRTDDICEEQIPCNTTWCEDHAWFDWIGTWDCHAFECICMCKGQPWFPQTMHYQYQEEEQEWIHAVGISES